MIEVENLSVRYPSRDEYSIRNISFSVRKGEFIWLSGDSASGKSTLMNCLCGFIPQIIPAEVEGTIKLNGRGGMNTLQLARQISMVHQDPESQFCTEHVEDEIAFGLENRCISRRKISKRIKTTLRDLNCSELRHRKLSTLSGGEKQKIAIASMLVLNPRVLILDEPTSNLDPESMEEVLRAIEEVRRKSKSLSLILAEHRVKRLVDYVDRVIRLESGELTEDFHSFQELTPQEKEKLSDYSYPDYKRGTKEKGRSVLKIDKLDYTINGTEVLDNINLDVKQGEIIALMGKNGSGKTTLIKHISGLIEVQKGDIKVFQVNMNDSNRIPPWKLGKKIGYVFQNPNHQLFENTVKGEMMFAPINFSRGLKNTEKRLKDITKEPCVEETTHPHNLSFGQKRRLNVYSSSLHGPEVMIIDEPFSGQDHKNALLMAEIMDSFWRCGKTLIIVTHDSEFADKFCTRTVVMRDGKVVYDGVPDKAKHPEVKIDAKSNQPGS
ncbi:MAG: ATP-binding cassette domain-containing protein [Thermoplasmata archaeon]